MSSDCHLSLGVKLGKLINPNFTDTRNRHVFVLILYWRYACHGVDLFRDNEGSSTSESTLALFVETKWPHVQARSNLHAVYLAIKDDVQFKLTNSSQAGDMSINKRARDNTALS